MKKALLLLTVLSCLTALAEICLVRDGVPQASLVVGNPDLAPAAAELQHWLQAISGAELPVVSAVEEGQPQLVLACGPEILERFPEDAAALKGTDGYAVRTVGETTWLFSPLARGVSRGVCRWLFKNTDIIWARPNPEFGTFFTKNSTLVFQEDNYCDVPRMSLRGWQFSDTGMLDTAAQLLDWSCRNGGNWYPWATPANYASWQLQESEWRYGHNLIGYYITEDKYYAVHPEYFAWRDGRYLSPSKEPDSAQPCFSNEGFVRQLTENLEAEIAAHPEHHLFMLGQEDNNNYCCCEECRKPIALPDGTFLEPDDPRFMSTRWALALNQVARHVAERFPDVHIRTYAYLRFEAASAIPLEKNLSVLFCPIHRNNRFQLLSDGNPEERENLQGWIRQKAPLVLYEYYGLQVLPFPRAVDRIAAQDIRTIYRAGLLEGVHAEIAHDSPTVGNGSYEDTWSCNAMYYWVISQLEWDPEQDVDQLRRTFLQRVYGPAAEPVGNVLELAEAAFLDAPCVNQFNNTMTPAMETLLLHGDYDKCCAYLAEAEAVTTDPQRRRMLEGLCRVFREDDYMKQARKYLDDFKAVRADASGRQNLVQNGDFEELAANAQEMFGKVNSDWIGSGFKQWNFWRHTRDNSTFGPALTQGRNDSTAAGVTNIFRYCFIQEVPVKPGQGYFLKGRVKTAGRCQRISASVWWQNASSIRTTRFANLASEPDAEGWRTFEALLIPPPGATSASLQLGCGWENHLHELQLYDDIEWYELIPNE